MDKLCFVRLLRFIWQIPRTHHSTIHNNKPLSLITALFEDLFEAITIHKDFCGMKMDPKPSISLMNKTNTLNGYDFTINIFEDEVNALQKELLMLFEAYCIFGYREFYKNLLCILMEVNETMYGNNEGAPDKLLDIFLLSSPGIRNHMNWQVGALILCSHSLIKQSLTNRKSSSTIL
jgi:hypothetical protein